MLNTQRICEAPECECPGVADECCCRGGGIDGRCSDCGAPLVLVDIDTGKTVAEPADPRQGTLL